MTEIPPFPLLPLTRTPHFLFLPNSKKASHPFQNGMGNLLPISFPPTANSIMHDATLKIEMTGIWLPRFYAAMENTMRIQHN